MIVSKERECLRLRRSRNRLRRALRAIEEAVAELLYEDDVTYEALIINLTAIGLLAGQEASEA